MPDEKWDEILACTVEASLNLGKVSPEFPRRVDLLIENVQRKLSSQGEFKICFHPRNYEANFFLGSVEMFESDAHIYYDLDQNLCWRRFIVTKEMCHILYFELGDRHLAATSDSICQLIEKISAGLEKADLDNDYQARSETMTMLMALEILLPHSERSAVRAILDNGDELDVARNYRVPVQFVRIYLQDWYASLMDRAYRISDIARNAVNLRF